MLTPAPHNLLQFRLEEKNTQAQPGEVVVLHVGGAGAVLSALLQARFVQAATRKSRACKNNPFLLWLAHLELPDSRFSLFSFFFFKERLVRFRKEICPHNSVY